MAIDERRMAVLASIHPALPEKVRMDEEERARLGERYQLFYEKTYGSGNVDSYESSVKAVNDEEAVLYAREKLRMKDILARYDTNITDALLLTPDGRKLPVPPYSKMPEPPE